MATALLAKVRRHCELEQIGIIYLHCLEGNKEAIRLYMKNDFRCQRRLEGFYRLDSSEVHDGLLFSAVMKKKDLGAHSSDQICTLVPPLASFWNFLSFLFA